jgi:ABC-type nitrate/sulfonate/bicarbonate transport system permease component
MTRLRWFERAAFFLGLLLFWQFACGRIWPGSRILASPLRILESFVGLCRSGALPRHVLASLGRILGGYLAAAPLGVLLGLLLGVNKRLRYFGEPLLAVLRPIPPLAWVPLSILWFGLGNGPAFFVTAIAAFFPVFTNTLSGVDNVPKRYLEVARIFGAGENLKLRDIVFPAALPFIAAGLRVGLMVAWMSVIAAEMVSSSHGLGSFIESSQEMLDTPAVMVGMITIGLVGVAMDLVLKRLERRFLRWT